MLKQSIINKHNKVSETEEFEKALPEICDYFVKNGQGIDAIEIIRMIQLQMKQVEKMGIEELLKQDFYVVYPKMAELIKVIYDKELEYF